jgi:hypothetical protein
LPKTEDVFEDFIDSEEANDGFKKNPEKAQAFKDLGNESYKAKKLKDALQKYTKCIQFAPSDQDTLAIGFANRSAVFFQMKEYEKAILDIKRAMESGYPKGTRYKLLERKTKSLLLLKRYNEMHNSLNEFLTSMDEATGLAPEIKTKTVSSLHKLIEQAMKQHKSNGAIQASGCQNFENRCKSLPKVPNADPKIPAFSKSVKIDYDSKRGRHGIATRDISAGELIAVEDPVAFILNPSCLGCCCTHCFAQVDNGIGSDLNSKDLFCSEDCLEEACNTYHKYESKMQSQLLNCGLVKSEWFLALRIITQKPISFFRNPEFGKEKHDTRFGTIDGDSRTYESNYVSLYNLVTLKNNRSCSLGLFKTFVIVFFLKLLQRVGYMEPEEPDLRLIGKK